MCILLFTSSDVGASLLLALCIANERRWVQVGQRNVLSPNLCVSAACLLCICLSVNPGETWLPLKVYMYERRARAARSIFGRFSSRMHLGRRYKFSQAGMIVRVTSLSLPFPPISGAFSAARSDHPAAPQREHFSTKDKLCPKKTKCASSAHRNFSRERSPDR